MTQPAGAPPGDRPGARTKDRSRLRRRNAVAALAPLVGLFLVMPPVTGLFSSDVTIFGAPLIVVYLFAIWSALILWARRFARDAG